MKIKSLAPLLIALFIFAVPAFAADEIYADDVMTAELFTDSAGTSLPYRLYIPPTTATGNSADEKQRQQRLPLLLYLHGSGHRGDDNELQVAYEPGILYAVLNSAYSGCILVAPQCAPDYQWVDTPWSYGSYDLDSVDESRYLRAVYELILSLKTSLPVDADRIYVTGISMGGYGTWDIIERHPELFAAALPVCGAGDPSKAELIKDLPVWCFHGDFDHVVPPERQQGHGRRA